MSKGKGPDHHRHASDARDFGHFHSNFHTRTSTLTCPVHSWFPRLTQEAGTLAKMKIGFWSSSDEGILISDFLRDREGSPLVCVSYTSPGVFRNCKTGSVWRLFEGGHSPSSVGTALLEEDVEEGMEVHIRPNISHQHIFPCQSLREF